jgi:hypothetical protein
VHTGIWWEDLRERDHLEDLGVEEDNITMNFQKVGWGARTGMMWSRTRTGGGLL